MLRFCLGDSELSSILSKELDYEKANFQEENLNEPEFLSEFQSKNLFSISDQPGENEVTLTREYGMEKVMVTFSIDDVVNAQSEEESDAVSLPISAVITITKPAVPAVGALTFQSIMEDGAVQITNVTHSRDPALAMADTAEADYKRRGEYIGPVFEELDDALSAVWYDYLDARGVNAYLAEFIPAYVEWKEQKEYMRWLEMTKQFIDRK
jgi:complement component 1 Q subcomponent-binding protein